MLLLVLSPAVKGAQVPLETVPASRETVEAVRVFDGVVEAVSHSTVSAQVSQRIVEILYDIDDYVPKGSVILRFRDSQERARLEQAQAALREAQARFREAQSEFERIKGVFEKRLVSKQAMDKASAELKAARARLEAAGARVNEAQEQLEHTVVRAPYSGIVTERHVEVGETPRIGDPLMTGLSLDKLRVTVRVPQAFVHVLRKDCCKARVSVPGREQAPVESADLTVFPIASAASHTFEVRVHLPEGQHDLYPGMFVKTAIVTGQESPLLIPARAVVHRSEVTGVYVVSDDRIAFRHIRLGRSYDDKVQVLAGLRENERVALDPVGATIDLKEQQGSQ